MSTLMPAGAGALLKHGPFLLFLLTRSFSLRLLLLPNHSTLRLLRLRWLTYPLSLRFTGCTHACQRLRRTLLLTQLSHLLSRRLVAARSLSCEIGHLTFTSLVGRDVRRLLTLLRCRVSLIRNLKLLITRASGHRLNIERPCEIAFKRRRDWCICNNYRRLGYALFNVAWDIDPPSRFARL